ncbi:oxysterol-binding protein-related protein 7 [Latimeria chalumnae]|uniref:oxysterol-binding protein-related protein 7 n=1 Tax=Latimeria chalumnae TaxID=7897 RepID=UPI00313CA779
MSGNEKDPSATQKPKLPSRANSSASLRHVSRQSSMHWEVVEEPRSVAGGSSGVAEALGELQMKEGYLLKKRKWPLKGWHKRYFVLDRGVLKYAKTPQDLAGGRLHGSIDVRLSVMSINRKSKRIDLDAGDNLYHLKVKSQEFFTGWVSALCRQHLLQKGDSLKSSNRSSLPGTAGCPHTAALYCKVPAGPRPSLHLGSAGIHTPFLQAGLEKRGADWAKETEEMEKCSERLVECQGHLIELAHLLQSLELLHRVRSAPLICDSQCLVPERPKKTKRAPKIWCTQSFAKDDTISRATSGRLHASVPNLPVCLDSNPLPHSYSHPTESFQLQQDFCGLAEKVHSSLKSAFSTLSAERERLRRRQTELDLELQPHLDLQPAEPQKNPAEAATLKSGVPNCLQKICSFSISSDNAGDSFVSADEEEVSPCAGGQALTQQLSNGSSLSLSDSHIEFFDAFDVILSASSSENEASDDESYTSEITSSNSEENLDTVDGAVQSSKLEREIGSDPAIARRVCLPAPGPDTSTISLWNILRSSIGKDLSKVSMPVQLNEPLSALQRLCEELEYCPLLDAANRTDDPAERMVFMAAFAVSSYASAYHRAGSKPFNPVLGETYECEYPEKGFTFISEQVSHHPPISVCHAESSDFVFWQDVRWKNKFWGKSLEIVPVGTVNVFLPKHGDHYEWNKVTSCIHNILSGQRWIEHYGEVVIRNTKCNTCHCKISFNKARYWGSSVNEVQGTVLDESGMVLHRFFGKWHEGLYCGTSPNVRCIWKPNVMLRDFDKYYGFTQFALELNELTPDLRPLLPPTDTRLRPDQRLLEDGNVDAAELQKQRIEQLQRDRRKVMEENRLSHQPRFFRRHVGESGKESWVSNGLYWKLRSNPGFAKLDNPVLW